MPKSHGQAHGQMFIRRSEYDAGWGGKQKTIELLDRPLGFDCCALSLQPFQDPICTADGTVYDAANIYAWLRKYKVNPITGEKMAPKDLIALTMHKNSEGKWHCPVTLKEFTNGSHIVAIKTTGQVYSYDAVLRLNIERKDWKDLSTGESFTRSDILHIHDPTNLDKKRATNFFHVKEKLEFGQNGESETDKKMNLNPATAEVIRAVKSKSGHPESSSSSSATSSTSVTSSSTASKPSSVNKKYAPAVSFTATNVEYTEPEAKIIVKRTNLKGRVQFVTNFGTLDLILHCDLCPKTCENFLLLIDRGYYDGVIFHRSIKHFMLQGGDPEGTGKGGQSAWGTPFEDEIVSSLKHDGRGVLSMANRGPGTNGSQFFILYKSAAHLDGKHTVFGKLSPESMEVLKAMEAVETDANAKPLEPIRIIKAGIIENPLDANALANEKKQNDLLKAKKEQESRDKRERGLWFSNPSALPSGMNTTTTTTTGVGKYISGSVMAEPEKSEKKRSLNMDAPAPAKKRKMGEGWSVF